MPRTSTAESLMSRLDRVEDNLGGRIDKVQEHLTAEIRVVDDRVRVQNSRIGKCEAKLEGLTGERTAETRYGRKHVAWAFATAAVGSPVLIRAAEWLWGVLLRALGH